MSKVLVVEDDQELCTMIARWLADENFLVDVAHDGASGLDFLKLYSYDLAVIDWELPAMSGPEICRTYRSKGGSTPILMLTGKSTIDDKESGFNAGADDYLTKPFHPRELMVRLKALMKRPATRVESVIKVHDLELDTTNHVVRKAGERLHLMPKEFDLLEFLMRHPEQLFSAEALLNRVWPSTSDVSPQSIKVYIAKVRKKIDAPEAGTLIATVHGVGYKLRQQPGVIEEG